MQVAIQLDNLSSLNMRTDSSLFIALALQTNGHVIYYYHPDSLVYCNGSVMADIAPLAIQYRDDTFHPTSEQVAVSMDLSSFDLVLIRQDPPFDMNYITTCHLLARLPKSCLVLNNPLAIMEQPEKLSVLNVPDYIPNTIICSSINQASKEFVKQHQKAVVKPLYGYAGKDVILIEAEEDWQPKLLAMLNDHGTIVLQQFLPQVATHGDKRVFMLDGEIIGAFQRKPADGEIRANLAVGGAAFSTTLTAREKEICAKLRPWLHEKGLFFAGIDLIDGHLIEINITSPTGLTTLKQLGQLDFPLVADRLERYVAAHRSA